MTTLAVIIGAFFLVSILLHMRTRDQLAELRDGVNNAHQSAAVVNEDRLSDKNECRDRLDGIVERIIKLEDERKLQLELAGGGVWKTQSGHTLRIRDMSTNHIENTLRLFGKRADKEPFLSMKRELARREEDAEWQRKTEVRARMVADHAAECESEAKAIAESQTPINRLEAWLKTRAGRGVSANTVIKKIRELSRG